MRFVAGSIDIAASGAEKALSEHGSIEPADKVLSIIARNSVRNTSGNNVFMGVTGISTTQGWAMLPGEATPPVNFRDMGGSVRADSILFDVVTSGDDIDFVCILE